LICESGRRHALRAPFAFVALLAGLILLTQLGVGAAGAKPGKGGAAVQVKTKTQSELLQNNRLKVALKAKGTARVTVRAKYKGRKIAESATLKAKGKTTSETLRLKLTEKGAKRLSSCGPKKIKVVGTYKLDSDKWKAKDSRKLRQDASRCDSPYTPVPVENADRCDFLDPRVCLQPFPNDYFTKDDPTSPTGKRLNLNRESMPANIAGVHVDPTDINRADGFSPGNKIIVKVPEVETPAAFRNSGLVPITNLAAYDDPAQAVIVVNAETGERQPIWAELDANPTAVDPQENGPGTGDDVPGGIGQNPSNTGPVNLLIRPAENFDFGERYIVALRNLKDANNQPVPAPIGFRVYRDNDITDQPEVEARRPHMESIINDLTTKAGVDRNSLYMAWDFTVASQASVTGRATTIRDDAFARLGDTNLADRAIQGTAPNYTIGTVNEDPGNNLTRQVEGTLEVPCYLNSANCATGGQFQFDGNNQLTWEANKTTNVPFRCVIPNSVEATADSIDAAIPGTYGHGLLGSRTQVNGQSALANQSNTLWCAVDFAGFATEDLPTVIASLSDMSNFNKLVDRMQQGFVNFMYLSRALTHPDGFVDAPAFQMTNGASGSQPVIDTNGGRALYMGISQGGIMGGALTALEPNVDRSVLNVPGMNYSTLLRRSVDSDEYFKLPGLGLYANYPSELERPLLLSLVQLLWDRGEANGYAHNMTASPLPNTPPHKVLLQLALGDHQVANVSAEVEARTIGASVYTPALEPGRHWEQDPFMGIPKVVPTDANPFTGNALLVYYDGGPVTWTNPANNRQGSATPPNENVPPRPEWGYGGDPHGYPRASQDGRDHAQEWLLQGQAGRCADPDGYCFANGWTGAP